MIGFSRGFNDIVDKGSYYELILLNKDGEENGRAKIDKEDLNKAKRYSRWGLNAAGYVKNTVKGIYLHRLIMDAEDDDFVDHRKTGIKSKSDNRKKNLRICTKSQNGCNVKVRSDNTSGHKGVGWHEKRQQWRARISFENKVKHLGWFTTKEEAIKARKAAIKLHGEFIHEQERKSK